MYVQLRAQAISDITKLKISLLLSLCVFLPFNVHFSWITLWVLFCFFFIHTHINRNLFCNHFYFFVVDDHFSMLLHRCHTKFYSIKNARNFLYFIKFGHVRYTMFGVHLAIQRTNYIFVLWLHPLAIQISAE